MPYYHKLGKIPQKRHVQYRQPNGSLYKEQVIGTEGFSGISSILYHINPPTKVKEIKEYFDELIKECNTPLYIPIPLLNILAFKKLTSY